MKKKISVLLAVLLLLSALWIPALAAESDVTHVYDLSGLFTADENKTLESRAVDISQRGGCGVYLVTVDDYTDYGSGDVYQVATQMFNNADNGFGVGAERNGILLLLSMNERDWAMFVNGEHAEYAFDGYGQTALEESFLPAFGQGDWYGGFSGFLTACDEYLTLAASGEPVRQSVIRRIIPVVCVSCVISLVICLNLKGKMKTVRRKAEARTYVASGGLRLTDSYDRYTHTTESRRSLEKSSSGESGGGGSGRSGKF